MRKKVLIFLLLVFAVAAFFVFFGERLEKVEAGSNDNVFGWAWSENIGWISFNNTSGGGAVDYGVNVDTTTGIFSGYAWSENIGWISFERAVAGAHPLPPYNGSESYLAKMDL